MKHKGIYTACLIVLLAASLQAQVPIPDPLPPIDFTFSPAIPTSASPVELRISGNWPNNCVPQGANVVVSNNTIEVRMLLPGAVTCVEPVCQPILSAYGLNVSVGPLAVGSYSVLVRAVTCREVSDTVSVGSFTVGVPAGGPNGEPGAPVQVGPGTCVVLLQDWTEDGVTLRAGQAGIVVCCDETDCSGRLLVSWFLHTQGMGTTEDCVNDIPRAFQPGSARWIDPERVGLGICFDRCGILGQNAEGCFTLQTDDGRIFLLVAGSWLPMFLGPNAEFELGDRVRVQGAVNIARPMGAFFACTEQDGDIFNPLITPCVPAGNGNGNGAVGCCNGILRPGDRVRLLVNNPPDLAGMPAMNLPAGTLGTVLCCNAANPQFRIYVSFDNFQGGTNMGFLCDRTPIAHPANSAWWVNCADVVPLAGGNGNGNGQPCPDDNLIIGFGTTGIRLFRDPDCPATPRSFTGCANVTVTTNFRARLSLNITPLAGINGTWQGTITPDVVSAGQNNVLVCVTADGVNLAGIPAGQNVKVANLAILAVPEPAP